MNATEIAKTFREIADNQRGKIVQCGAGDFCRGLFHGSASAYEHAARVIEREAAKDTGERPPVRTVAELEQHLREVRRTFPNSLSPDGRTAGQIQDRIEELLKRPEVIDGLQVEAVIRHDRQANPSDPIDAMTVDIL